MEKISFWLSFLLKYIVTHSETVCLIADIHMYSTQNFSTSTSKDLTPNPERLWIWHLCNDYVLLHGTVDLKIGNLINTGDHESRMLSPAMAEKEANMSDAWEELGNEPWLLWQYTVTLKNTDGLPEIKTDTHWWPAKKCIPLTTTRN